LSAMELMRLSTSLLAAMTGRSIPVKRRRWRF